MKNYIEEERKHVNPKGNELLYIRRRYNPQFFHLKDVVIGLCTILKYLRLWFDRQLSSPMSTCEKVAKKIDRKAVTLAVEYGT